MKTQVREVCLGIPNFPAHRLAVLATVIVLLAGALCAQNSDSPAIYVAHP